MLADHLCDGLSFLIGFVGKPAEAPEQAVVAIGETPYRIVLDDKASLATQRRPRPRPSQDRWSSLCGSSTAG
jgi:hypothetical protein